MVPLFVSALAPFLQVWIYLRNCRSQPFWNSFTGAAAIKLICMICSEIMTVDIRNLSTFLPAALQGYGDPCSPTGVRKAGLAGSPCVHKARLSFWAGRSGFGGCKGGNVVGCVDFCVHKGEMGIPSRVLRPLQRLYVLTEALPHWLKTNEGKPHTRGSMRLPHTVRTAA